MAARRIPAFRGRAQERKILDDALDEVRAANGGVLVLRGDAGIGKTALLRYAARQAAGCRVVQIAGVESELEMPFAALHQLCAPLLSHTAKLPDPQARAVRTAFGLATGSPPDRFIVGLAVLGLLAEAATERPLVCLVDDAQWLDDASLQVLGFVARRLLAEAVLLLIAARETDDRRAFPGLPALALAGLTDADARALLTATILWKLDSRIRDRIVAETGGNPLGLLELPKGMSPAELAGGFAVPTTASISDQLHSLYLRRVRALPAPTRHLMLLAAADPTGDAALVWRAASALEIGHEAAVAADADQLLEIAAAVRFRHPLVRSAAYAAGSASDRRAMHLALAQATDVRADPERRLWHLASATAEPDEGLARELERTAETAQARAGLAAAAAFLQRASVLTADPVRRADRALAAAAAHLHAGAFDAARSSATEAAAVAADDLQRARVEQLTGQIEAAANPGREAPVQLLRAARRLESLDVRRARETYLQAWWAAVLAGQFAATGGDLAEVCRAARSAPRPAEIRPCDLLLDGLATMVIEGRAAAAPSLRRAVDLFRTDQVSVDDWIQWGRSATTAAFALWDADSWAELSTRQVALARASGALTSLVLSLNYHGFMTTACGDLEAATAVVAEHDAVKDVTGIRMAPYGARLLAAYQGRPMDLAPQLAAVEHELVERGDGYALQIASLATAVLNNGLGRYTDALAAAREVAYELSFLAPFALSELIEAATRSDNLAAARDALQRLSTHTLESSDWAMGLTARSQALLSDGNEAERCYGEAVDRLERTRLRPDLARAHLLYGEWLRREGRRLEAREQLRTAYDMFTAMGLDAFAERARRELSATGEKLRKRQADASNELTAQEEHIARLARDGQTNAEIGAELFVSARTVEWHLRKVFSKLGIASRRELHDALPSGSRP